MRRLLLNKKDDDRQDDAVKLSLYSKPTNNLSISLISNYMKKDDGAATIAPLSSPDPRTTNVNFEGYTRSKSLSSALQVEYAWDNKMAFTSVSTYKKYDDIRGTDYDYSPADIMHSEVDSEYLDYSQEFRLNGQTGRLNWLTGLYLDKNDEKKNYAMSSMPFENSETRNKGIGIFANIEYGLSEKLILISGLRYDKDDIETDDYLQNYTGDKSYNEVSPKVGMKYIHNGNILYYTTISKGYKRGGFFFLAPTDKRSYDAETLWNYEAGLKARLLDNKLSFNASAFYMDITNMQVLSNIDTFTAYVSNAAKATSKGVELETSYRVLKPLMLFANIGLAQTQFDSFRDGLDDYTGNDNPFAPAYNYSVGFIYRDTRGIFARFDINGQDEFYTDKANDFKNGSHAIMNAKIGYEAKNYEIYLYGKNISNVEYDIKGYFDTLSMLSPPREIGVQLAYRF